MPRSPRSWLILVMARLVTPIVLCSLGASLAPAAAAAAPTESAPRRPRLALVVGNAAYRPSPAPTAANDAGLVAQALAQDGFAVTALADPDAATLRKAVDGFAGDVKRAGHEALVFVYISGVGVQYGGVNFLVPAPAAIAGQADIPRQALPFSDILRTVEDVPAYARFFVFDLAHPTPLATAGPIPLAGGLRHMQPSAGSLYAFNTAPGMVAPDSVPLYGLYARALVEALRTPGLKLHNLFSRIRLRVAEETAGAVVPWDNGDLDPDLAFLPAGGKGGPQDVANRPIAGVPVQTVFWAALAEDTLAGYQTFLKTFPKEPLAARVRVMKAVRLEAANWAEACRADSAAAYWTFMRRYPRGPHYVDVRRRLEIVGAALIPPMRFDPTDLGGLPSPTDDELRTADRPQPARLEDMPAIPPAPDGLLPPPPTEVDVDLMPPPFAPRGALPVAFPIFPGLRQFEPGRITQPFVAGLGPLTMTMAWTQADGTVMTLASGDGPITRTKASFEGHARSLLQTDAADEIVSRTSAKRAGDTLTIEQTGLDGRLVVKLVTRFSLNGDQETIVDDGADRLVAEVKTDRRSVIKSIKRGPGTIEPATIDLAPAVGRRGRRIDDRITPPGTSHPPSRSQTSPVPPSEPKPKAAGETRGAPAALPPESALRMQPAEPTPDGPPEPTRPSR